MKLKTVMLNTTAVYIRMQHVFWTCDLTTVSCMQVRLPVINGYLSEMFVFFGISLQAGLTVTLFIARNSFCVLSISRDFHHP